MAKIILEGDIRKAGSWVGYAKTRLNILKRYLTSSSLNVRKYCVDEGEIVVSSYNNIDKIQIRMRKQPGLIICYAGETTGDFALKLFLDSKGVELARDTEEKLGRPSGWSLIDDGKYGPSAIGLDPTNPWNNTYAYDAGGVGIPSNGSGIPTKKVTGRKVRYILNGTLEEETFEAFVWRVVSGSPVYDYTYQFVRQVDSLTYAPYSIFAPKPYFSKYFDDSIVSMIVPWSASEATLTWDSFASDNFRDLLPKVHRIWKTKIEDSTRTYTEIDDYGNIAGTDAIIAATGRREVVNEGEPDEEEVIKTVILRAKSHLWFSSKMAEPIRKEIYNLIGGTMVVGDEYHRCSNPANELCYYVNGGTTSGVSTISNDIYLPYAINENGEQTYIRIQKNTAFTSVNIGLYCFDDLVEESGWQNVNDINPTDIYGGVQIRQTGYRIIHTFFDENFKAVVYSKTVYDSYEEKLLPYKAYSPLIGDYGQVRKTMVRSLTTYHIAVNGEIFNAVRKVEGETRAVKNYKREYKLTAQNAAYTGDPVPAVHGHIVTVPWVDAGYDEDGADLQEDNMIIQRCFMDSTESHLFVGFDIYPVKYRHGLVYDIHDNLTLEFDENVVAFPPSTDARYEKVTDRKWLLFGKSGKKVGSVAPPKIEGDYYNRINGLALLEVA